MEDAREEAPEMTVPSRAEMEAIFVPEGLSGTSRVVSPTHGSVGQGGSGMIGEDSGHIHESAVPRIDLWDR